MEHRKRSVNGFDPSDEQLVDQAVAGDKTSFVTLRHRHNAALMRFSQAQLRRAGADDLSQEVWLQVYKHLNRWKKQSTFRTWLFAIAKNLARSLDRKDNLQRYSIDKTVSLDELRLNGFDVAGGTGNGFDRVMLKEALDLVEQRFPKPSQFLQLMLQGYTMQEIADQFGTSTGYIKTNLFRARKYLREIYYGEKEIQTSSN